MRRAATVKTVHANLIVLIVKSVPFIGNYMTEEFLRTRKETD